MSLKKQVHRAELNLQRKLEWISRYEARVVFVAGVEIAMLGVLASASGKMSQWSCGAYILFGIAVILLVASLVCIYLAQTPKVSSPNKSLLFFGTISKLEFREFTRQFKGASDRDYLDDLLYQIYINSSVLCRKFKYLKYSFFCLGASIIPWVLSIYFSKLYI